MKLYSTVPVYSETLVPHGMFLGAVFHQVRLQSLEDKDRDDNIVDDEGYSRDSEGEEDGDEVLDDDGGSGGGNSGGKGWG